MSQNWLPIKGFQIFLMSLCSVASLAQPKVDLTEGTLYVTGSLALKYDMIGFEKTQHSFGLNSDVGGGYFFIDRLALGLSVPVEWRFAPTSGGAVGLKISSSYFFDVGGAIFPYGGVSVTPGYSMTEKAFKLLAGLEAGVLMSLSESVALDFGLRPEVTFKLYNSQVWKFSLPAGFVGVRAFF